MAGAEISIFAVGDNLHLARIIGEVDHDSAPACKKRLVVLCQGPRPRLVIDLGGVRYMDSSGVEVLIALARLMQDRQGTMVLLSTSPYIRKILRMTTQMRLFDVVDSLDQAIARLGESEVSRDTGAG